MDLSEEAGLSGPPTGQIQGDSDRRWPRVIVCAHLCVCVHVCVRENTAARYSGTREEGRDAWFTL